MKLLPTGADRATRAPVRGGAPIVVIAESDPYLALLIRLHVPEARVVEVGPGASADDLRAEQPDLVLVGVETSSVALADLLGSPGRPKVLAVVDGARAARAPMPSPVDGVLARPYVPGELHEAVRGALGLAPHAPDFEGGVRPALARARSWLGPARFAGVVFAAILEAAANVANTRAIVLALAFVYATARWVFRRPSMVADAADAAVAAALVATTGALASPYILFALMVAAGGGLTRGPRWGSIAGLTVVAASSPVVYADLTENVASWREVVAWTILFPLLGLTAGFGARVWRLPAHDGLGMLAEANRILSSLYRIARTLPGGLELGTVADAAVSEIRETLRSPGGAMLLSEAGTFRVASSFGLADPGALVFREAETDGFARALLRGGPILRAEEIPSEVAALLGEPECWLVAPMRRGGITLGLLLAACSSHAQHDSNRLLLQQLAQESSVAVDNARLFSRVREISIDEERQRLARELHDGVAQALTHVRYELDFLARHSAGDAPMSGEVRKLARVVERAAGDVRGMILGLRSSVSGEGLVGSLRSYLADLSGLRRPDIVFQGREDGRLPPDVEAELFRIAQEAVSNAVQHAGATEVRVSLTTGPDRARLIVEDDGVGLSAAPRRERKGSGVGLKAMRERASSIGARLDLGERVGGGTRVLVDYSGKVA